MSTNPINRETAESASWRELAALHDIPVQVSVELGRVHYRVRDLIKLAPNTILELKKPAGEPLDICINGHQVARGEVMVAEDTSGIRIIEVSRTE
jgi:flagellar motor switch protein FliN/FliY